MTVIDFDWDLKEFSPVKGFWGVTVSLFPYTWLDSSVVPLSYLDLDILLSAVTPCPQYLNCCRDMGVKKKKKVFWDSRKKRTTPMGQKCLHSYNPISLPYLSLLSPFRDTYSGNIKSEHHHWEHLSPSEGLDLHRKLSHMNHWLTYVSTLKSHIIKPKDPLYKDLTLSLVVSGFFFNSDYMTPMVTTCHLLVPQWSTHLVCVVVKVCTRPTWG